MKYTAYIRTSVTLQPLHVGNTGIFHLDLALNLKEPSLIRTRCASQSDG